VLPLLIALSIVVPIVAIVAIRLLYLAWAFWMFTGKDTEMNRITFRRGKPNTGKLPRLDERKREKPVPVLIDPFEPRMPQNRSLEKRGT
jgi:hypothetical protein